MRLRAVGVATLLFGLVGAFGSFGLWWIQFRYLQSVNKVIDNPPPCTSHCGGVDGPYLRGVLVSAVIVLAGLVLIVRSLTRRPPSGD